MKKYISKDLNCQGTEMMQENAVDMCSRGEYTWRTMKVVVYNGRHE
jgi:hypothetical protein